MAAKTIKNLLVGIGYNVDKKSFDNAEGSIALIGKRALAMGGLLVGAFGVSAKAASDFAEKVDPIGKFSEIMGVLPGQVYAMGNALKSEGGTLEGFLSQLQGIEKMRAGILTGDVGWIANVEKAGINSEGIINATNALEAYIELADQMAGMSRQGRLNAADALGLDEASIRLLATGEKSVRGMLDSFEKIRPITKEMTENAKAYNDEWLKLTENVGGFFDQIGNEVSAGMASGFASVNEWIDENRTDIKDMIQSEINGFKFVGDIFSGDDLGSYSVGGVTFDQMGDYLNSLVPTISAPRPEPQQGNSYRGQVIREAPEITLHHQTILEGCVVEDTVKKINSREAQQAIENLTSSVD